MRQVYIAAVGGPRPASARIGSRMDDVTALLRRWSGGDRGAFDELVPVVYGELRRIARRALANERSAHTLQPTALVHEAFLRLVDERAMTWQNRAHFFAVAAGVLRRILVDHARRRLAQKRGGGAVVSGGSAWIELAAGEAVSAEEVLALDAALAELARLDPERSRVVELRYFAGLTVEETAASLGVSTATVKRDWAAARAFLHREMRR
jgi:RNA polymerase sigma-70 factor, ECF subfamily